MAKAKEKKIELAQWSEYFEEHEMWGNQYLIRRNGSLISGICLDERRDPRYYKPTFFIHNVLVPFPVVSLGYSVPFLINGVSTSVKYGDTSIDAVASTLKEQLPILNHNITMVSFIDHVESILKGEFQTSGIYPPHFFKDVITIGSCFGETNYYQNTISEATCVLAKTSGLFNINIIGSVEEWRDDVENMVNQSCNKLIDTNIEFLKLPELNNEGLLVEEVDFLNIYKAST